MNKKFLIISAYTIYVALLFIKIAHYEFKESWRDSNSFLPGLGSFFGFLNISIIYSSAFLITAYIIYRKLSPFFLLFVPFFNLLVAVAVGYTLSFILWIAHLKESVSDLQQTFMIAALSTMITTLLFMGDVFKSKIDKNMTSKDI